VSGQWYGVVRAAKDPQRWANKFFSQVMFLLNSQSKGGVAAEKGAVEDVRQFEESWAKSDEVTWLKNGALSGPNPQIIPKPAAQFPAGFFTLFQETKEAITQVTGLSPEFLGTREVDQAGVLEYQRRQSSLNILAGLFNALRRYRMRQGRLMLYLIQEHLADGRLVRIVGEDKKQYVPLTKESVANIRYDIIVDDAPTSPNEKERTFQIVQSLLPVLKDYITPEIGLELLKVSPLPASVVEKITKQAAETAKRPPPPSPEEVKMQADQAKAAIDIQSKQQSAEIDAQSKGIDLYMKQQEAAIDIQVAEQKLGIDQQKLVLDAQKMEIARQNMATKRTAAASAK